MRFFYVLLRCLVFLFWCLRFSFSSCQLSSYILFLLFCLLSPSFSFSPFFVFSCRLFPFSCHLFCFSSLSFRSSCFFLGSSCRLCPPFAHLSLLLLHCWLVISFLQLHLFGGRPSHPAPLLSSLPVFLSDRFLWGVSDCCHLCFSFLHLICCSCCIPVPPTPLHFFRFHRLLRCSCPIPALRLLSTAVCLSDCFLLDDASFRHLCFRFLHLLRCSCPIPSPSLSPFFSLLSSFLLLFLLFLDVICAFYFWTFSFSFLSQGSLILFFDFCWCWSLCSCFWLEQKAPLLCLVFACYLLYFWLLLG